MIHIVHCTEVRSIYHKKIWALDIGVNSCDEDAILHCKVLIFTCLLQCTWKTDESSSNIKIQSFPSEKPWQLMYLCHMTEVIDIPSKWRYRAPVSCVWQIFIPLSSRSACFPATVRASEPRKDSHFHVCFFTRKLHFTTAFLVSFTSLFYPCQFF